MIPAYAMTLTAAVLCAGAPDTRLIRGGGDPARGVLVNHTIGARPFDPPDRSLPTVVFVHGFNPMPRVVRFSMADRFAESFHRRGGPPFNLLGWDWNAATFDNISPKANAEAAVRQGQALASALWFGAIDPGRTHLIGHSAGGMVVTSAARDLALGRGRPVAQLTLLDPATLYHSVIFERLAAGSLSPRVENFWSPGPSAFGREVALPGVQNIRVDGPASYAGLLCPLRSDHLFIVRWYLDTVADGRRPWGFNTSVLASR